MNDLEKNLHEIFVGEKHVFFNNHFLVIKHPNTILTYRANSIYEHWLESYRDQELMSREELTQHLNEEGSWTKQDEEDLQNLIKKIVAAEEKMEDEKFSSQKYILQKRHKELIVDYGMMLERKNRLYTFCAEEMADRKRIAFLLAMTIEENGAPLWGSIEKVENEDNWDLLVFCEIGVKYILNRFDIKTLRKIARSTDFRMRWNSAKKIGAAFFSDPPALWNPIQTSLLAWANFYDQVYEDTQRPDDTIIQDDEQLDHWWGERIKELERERQDYLRKKGGSSYKGKLSAFKHDDVILVGESREKYKDLITDSIKKRRLMAKATESETGTGSVSIRAEELDRPSLAARKSMAKGRTAMSKQQ